MAFGASGVLDNFNRANGPVGSDWSMARELFGSALFTIETQRARPSADYVIAYYNPSTYGAACEVFVTANIITNTDNDGPYICTRLVQPGNSTLDGYLLRVEYNGTNFNWEICRVDNGTLTQVGATATSDLANDEKIGLESIGNTHKGYRYTGGAWSEILSRDDSNHPDAGNLGLYIGADDQNQRYDDFSGGTLATESSSVSPSASPSGSRSISPSASKSPSASQSPSASGSPSASASPSPGVAASVCWGHVTGVLEANTRTFTGNWTGTGTIENAGDLERIALDEGDAMDSEIVDTGGAAMMEIDYNHYRAGDAVTVKYRTGATPAACVAAAWNDYTVPFASTGYVQIRMEG